MPGEPDLDHDIGEKILTEEEIEYAAHEFMKSYRNIDLMHTFKRIGTPVESYILPTNLNVTLKGKKTILPRGTWIVAAYIDDDETWEAIKSGELSGFSVTGIPNTSLKSVLKSSDGIRPRKTLIKDLGEDWIACSVSVVDTPAVPKAKWFALKRKDLYEGDDMEKNSQLTESLKGVYMSLQALFKDETEEDSDNMEYITKEAFEAEKNKMVDEIEEKLGEISSKLDEFIKNISSDETKESDEEGEMDKSEDEVVEESMEKEDLKIKNTKSLDVDIKESTKSDIYTTLKRDMRGCKIRR